MVQITRLLKGEEKGKTGSRRWVHFSSGSLGCALTEDTVKANEITSEPCVCYILESKAREKAQDELEKGQDN